MASDKLMNHTQGETIITKLTAIADSLDDLAAVTPAKLGMGIATCDTAASTAAKTAALANFALVEGAPVSVKFTYANTAANATLNINNTGAKPIIYKNAAIGNDVISAGDTCTFIYTTNTYKITNIDTLTGPGSGTVRQVGAENGLMTDQTDNADIQTTGNIGLNLKSTTAFSTEVGAHNTSTDNMYPVALDSEGHPVAAVPTMSASGSGHKGGLVPDPGSTAGTKKYLAENGEWKAPDSAWPSTPTDNTIPSSKLVKDSLDAKVAGPGSSTQNNIATYSDTSGKTVKDSGVHVVNYATGADTSKDDEVPTSKAVNKMITDKGYVVGPSSVTGDTIALFDSTTGKLIKSSSKTFDSSAISNDANKVPTSKLVYEGLGGKVPTSRTINDKELSNNVTLSGDDLKLTKYSKTTSKDSLAATDKVNQAFDKLENRIVANQSNILLVQNKVGKNNLDNAAVSKTASNITFTVKPDKTVELTTTQAASATEYVVVCGTITDYAKNIYKGMYLLGSPNTVSGSTYFYRVLYSINGTGQTAYDDLTTAEPYQIRSNYEYLKIIIICNSGCNIGSTPVIFKPMIVNESIVAAGLTEYEPYALPNYDLTRLEAEDRAALAEEIDAGAKNKWDFANATFSQYNGSTYTKTSDSITVTSTGTWAFASYALPALSAGKYVISFTVSNLSGNTARLLISSSSQASQGSYYESVLVPSNGNYNLEFTSTGSQLYVLFYPNYSGTSSTTAKYTASNIMVATKAAFGVSNKFVPYRPNYDLVATRSGIISKLQEIGTDWTLIDLTFTGTAAYVYTLSAVVNASGNFPTGIAISTSNNASDFLSDRNLICKNDESPRTTRMMSCSALDIPYTTTTYYVWAKSLTSSTNYVTLTYYREGR